MSKILGLILSTAKEGGKTIIIGMMKLGSASFITLGIEHRALLMLGNCPTS
jgi:hypothetical protein